MSYLFNQPTIAKRTGKKNRVNTDRFFHIMNEGWFVYMRKDKLLIEKITTKDGIAGPFQSKQVASDYLTEYLPKNPSAELEPTEGSNRSNKEDWRY